MKTFKDFLNEATEKYQDKLDKLTDETGKKIFLSQIMKVDSRYGNKLPAGIRNKYNFNENDNVSISKLIATQSSVELKPVKNILEKFNKKLVSIKVLNDNGELYVVDGHHTIVALSILGNDNKIPIKVHKIIK